MENLGNDEIDVIEMPRDNVVSKVERARILAFQSNEDRLRLLLEEKFPGKQAKVEMMTLTVPKDDEPFGVQVVRLDRGVQVGREGLKGMYATRGHIDGIAFYFEDDWSRSNDSLIEHVVDCVANFGGSDVPATA